MVQNPVQVGIPRKLPSTIVTTPTGKNPSTLKWLGVSFLLLVMAVLGLATIGLIGVFNTGPIGLVIGMVMGMLPVPLYLSMAIWIDRFEPEPPLLLALTFMWGATVAVFFSFLINSLGAELVAGMYGKEAGEFYGKSISAPIVEESFKAMALLAIFFFRRAEIDGVLDGVVYAAMVGLGFAMTENFSYYGASMSANVVAGGFVWILRGMILAFAHPLFTSMTGIGLALAVQSRNKAVKIIAPFAGFILAILLHSFNNTMPGLLASMFGTAGAVVGFLGLLVLIPFFCICVMVVVIFALVAEGKTVRQFLQPEVATGFFSQHEVDTLCSIPKRMGASWRSMRAGGYAGYRTRAHFHHIAAELAFFRSRLARGVLAQDANAIAQENEFRNALSDLRRKLPVV